MSEPAEYGVTLDELVSGVRVPLEQQVEEHDTDRPEHDDPAGHLPGGVRPYGA